MSNPLTKAFETVRKKFYTTPPEKADSETAKQELIDNKNRRNEQKQTLADIESHNLKLDYNQQIAANGITQTNGRSKPHIAALSDDAKAIAEANGYIMYGGKRRKSRLRKSKKRANKKSRKTRRR